MKDILSETENGPERPENSEMEQVPGATVEESKSEHKPHHPVAKFIAIFMGIIILSLLAYLKISDGELVAKYIRATAGATAWTLGLLPGSGEETLTYDGDVKISFHAFSVLVVPECGGIEAIVIYLAAVLAFPVKWTRKLLGTVFGVPLIFATNILRVSCLCMVGAWNLELFKFVHIYVWQVVFIVFVTVVWLVWVDKIAGLQQ
ncbi:exosortase H [Candidatus Hydrogenedentota bacterium]